MNPYPILLAVILSTLGTWYLTATYKDARYESIIQKANATSAKALAAETEKVRQLERANNKLSEDLSKANRLAEERNNVLTNDNRSLTERLRKLAKTNYRCTVPNTPKPSGSGSTSTAGGGGFVSISVEEIERVDTLTRIADKLNEAYRVCRKLVIKE